MKHHLKTWPEFYQAVKSGDKTFEERANDRDYKVEDTLVLEEFDPISQGYTGDVLEKRVPYLLGPPYAKDGHVIMSLAETKSCDNCLWNYKDAPNRYVCRECVKFSEWKDVEG